jgi:carboxypeptidase PM20D1
MKRLVVIALLALGLILTIAVVRALGFRSRQLAVAPARNWSIDPAPVAEKLAALIRVRTIAHQPNETPFATLHDELRRRFPNVHQTLAREQVGQSLIYTWTGREAQAAPLVLLAHQDVVPVEPETERKWHVPAFDGRIEGGFVWGRGALDDKANLVAELEAIEGALAAGWQPRRTIYLCFGADEEVGGVNGAAEIAARLRARGVRPLLVLDEGMAVLEHMLPVPQPVALIGVAEKGYLSLELTVDAGAGGHSSMPPKQTAIGVLAAALARLEAHPLPARLTMAAQLLSAIGPEMSFGKRLVMANLWLFGPLIARQLESAPTTNALVRTTTAETLLSAGVRENVLPATARAVVNFRLLPGDSLVGVTEAVRSIVADPRVSIARVGDMASEPSPVSPSSGPSFALLERTARQIFPDALVAPGLVLGATDARYYVGLTDAVYRFTPARLGPEDPARLHGVDERISVAALGHMVEFYRQLLMNSDS